MSILFHADLVDRDFGSCLLSVAKLSAWAQTKDLELVTMPPIDGFKFVQVEALLCAIERAVSTNTTVAEAAAIVQSTPFLAQDRAAEIAPCWLLGADAHQQWRHLIGQAVQAGELTLLDYGSKLPIQKADTKPQDAQTLPADIAPAVPESEHKPKRRTLWDVVTPYIVETMRAGQYATAKQLFNALEAKAGADSPFDKGTGNNRGSLFAREISQPMALKTLQTRWPNLQAAAKK